MEFRVFRSSGSCLDLSVLGRGSGFAHFHVLVYVRHAVVLVVFGTCSGLLDCLILQAF